MSASSCLSNLEDEEEEEDNDDEFQRILLPVLSSDIAPLRPSIIHPSTIETNQYECLFLESCAQLRAHINYRQWPFCPIYLLHINTYCHIDHLAIPAEIALVETTFWPQFYAKNVDIPPANVTRQIREHYERHSNLNKPCCCITDDFHDFVHPGDQLPIGYQAEILQHSRRTHALPCTPLEKIGTQDYNQLLDDLNEMLGSLCRYENEPMPMFCTIESFSATKSALDWLYDHPSTRDRTDDYTLYPIEALIAVIYENFYNRAKFKCQLGTLMWKTPQQPILHSRACDYHAILENKHCAMAHVRDLANYYVSLMAYLFYTYCDHNSAAMLPYIKVTYRGNLELQQQAYWSGKHRHSKTNHGSSENCYSALSPGGTSSFSSSSSSSDISSNCSPFDTSGKNVPLQSYIYLSKPRKYETTRDTTLSDTNSNLNPLAIPFVLHSKRKESNDSDKTPVQLVLFEPRTIPSSEPSCQTTHQRMHHRPREDWDSYQSPFVWL